MYLKKKRKGRKKTYTPMPPPPAVLLKNVLQPDTLCVRETPLCQKHSLLNLQPKAVKLFRISGCCRAFTRRREHQDLQTHLLEKRDSGRTGETTNTREDIMICVWTACTAGASLPDCTNYCHHTFPLSVQCREKFWNFKVHLQRCLEI